MSTDVHIFRLLDFGFSGWGLEGSSWRSTTTKVVLMWGTTVNPSIATVQWTQQMSSR